MFIIQYLNYKDIFMFLTVKKLFKIKRKIAFFKDNFKTNIN